ncbi:D-lysine 5,6-aminomutase alpha subunit, beta-lysine 5,6-aminomutase alpha subunit [Desulfosporosinus acidiphilus SJ4]|uniref:D-lysine 5,6-aminomutase alpha subunit, beta-lysine 5,6-aminomutase alpha subunit n=1 Tax=Desulfosporosinus acidiphilus (strain DSM 22704 / JCM 16185 / SJ4) TaxID=646529 RepID=I4D4X0_DESAJ|nr:lysine 5,6-aminomutase subunit alpha [Desulfosporosinus acidiphilus]AFM40844.1 D-lysine 5,6-aminomutase alpha subunit, beta-lysine 5,6-aminomutase alpha subunit [Desulfosporosinus acidiphilus SJ4]
MTRPYLKNKLHLDPKLINKARTLAKNIVRQITPLILSHSTVSVERTVLRLLGINGVDPEGIPLPNVVIDHLKEHHLLEKGAARAIANACLHYKTEPQILAEQLGRNELSLADLPFFPQEEIDQKAFALAQDAVNQILQQRQTREHLISTLGEGPEPYLYVIVATGNIYEDVLQARAAARQGADIIAVIRSTGQSLLDYVPYGSTTEGFGGTFATQENFRIMREALDQVGQELGRYIRLTNYCSGLCMPEIAAMGAIERLDVMLNDSMYGIIFRDINMQRTFIDQYFSRLINGFAGIIINTGEDNYLTTAEAIEAAHTVLASNFINEQFAFLSGLPEEQQGLGHAMEIDPDIPDSFLYEIAQAQLIREIFPRSPIKYMPPTKYMTGNIFRGHVQDTLFNAASVLTGQSIHLIGMLTEAIHTPLMQDRFLSLESAKLVFKAMGHFHEEITFTPDGLVHQRAQSTLQKAVDMLEEIQKKGLFAALEEGMFADISRKPTGGRGLDGVFRKHPQYLNPFNTLLNSNLTGFQNLHDPRNAHDSQDSCSPDYSNDFMGSNKFAVTPLKEGDLDVKT